MEKETERERECVKEREREREREREKEIQLASCHRMPYLHKSFSAKEPYIKWLFSEK